MIEFNPKDNPSRIYDSIGNLVGYMWGTDSGYRFFIEYDSMSSSLDPEELRQIANKLDELNEVKE